MGRSAPSPGRRFRCCCRRLPPLSSGSGAAPWDGSAGRSAPRSSPGRFGPALRAGPHGIGETETGITSPREGRHDLTSWPKWKWRVAAVAAGNSSVADCPAALRVS